MITNRYNLLIYFPGILWLSAGIKLLLKASLIVYEPGFSFRLFCLLAMGAWVLASLKYHYILSKSVSYQSELARQLDENIISKKTYIKKIFLSKRMLILVAMVSITVFIRKFIDNVAVLFFIRSAIGYALIKSSAAYFSKSLTTQSTNP